MIPFLALLGTSFAAIVTSNADSGPGTLRDAILMATPGEIITFDPAVTQITPLSSLPFVVADNVTIDGAGSVLLDGKGLAASGLTIQADDVKIYGLQITGFAGHGLRLQAANNTIIGGTGLQENAIYGNDDAGIWVGYALAGTTSSGTLIQGNRIGLRFDDAAVGNCVNGATVCAGVQLTASAGATTLQSNIVSGNHGHGVRVATIEAVTLQGNAIGLNATAQSARPNSGHGVLVNPIGMGSLGSVVLSGNLLSANDGDGLLLSASTEQVVVIGNGIGIGANGQPQGNGGNGITVRGEGHIIGLDGTTPAGNIVAANGESGITLEGHSHLLVHNTIGSSAPGDGRGNADYGVFTTGDYSTPFGVVIGGLPGGAPFFPNVVGRNGEGNNISGNTLGGVRIDTSGVVIEGNTIGLAADGTTPIGNGTIVPLSGAFGGVLVNAPVDWLPAASVHIRENTIAANLRNGIWVKGDSQNLFYGNVTINDNDIGIDINGLAQPNAGDGVRLEGGSNLLVENNIIAGNTSHGVHVLSTDTASTTHFTIQGNDIGTATVGNGVDGIRLDSSARQSVSGGIVEDNLLRNNGAHGIYNIGYATEDNELTRNDFADNGRCPLTMDAAARNDTWPAPEVVSFDSGSGIVELEHADADVADRIEVYWSSNIAVATFRGDATFVSGNTWTFDATGLGASSIDEFRAVAIAAADGETSEMTPRGGDGCSSLCPQPDPTNPCMVASFDGTQCQTVLRPTGYPCNDGDASTGSWRADDPSLELDHCVNTGATSTCTGGTPLTIDPVTFETDDCPLSSNCVTSYADPSTAACTYEAICGDGFCSPFDMDPDLQNGCGDRCTECQGLSMSDGDAIPDDWEVNLGAPWTRDWDCDGTPDADAYPPSGDAGQDELFLLLAWMAESCPDNTDANPNNDTNDTGFLQTMHHHKPHPSALAEVVQAFDNAGIDLEVELRCIPHYTQMHNSGGSNYDPDCNDLDEFIPFSQLKAKHFEPWRKGVYHFGVMGHGIAEKNINTSQQADGRCVSISQRSAAGETFGDDLRTYPEHGYDPKVDPPRANQNQRRLSETRSVMHELGHNLGLEHGGNGGKNKKPNYQSVMNYRYGAIREENGAAPFLDFSVVDDHALNESYLDEANGYESKVVTDLGLPPRLLSWTCPDGSPNFGWPQAANGLPRPIDWNCDGSTLQGATADIDGKSGLEVLTSHDDWFNLQMNMYCAGIPAWADTQTEYDPTRGVYTEQRWVDVDIAPSCPTNSLSVDDDFPVQAVLFGGPSLDVDELVASPRLGGATAARVHRSDVDGDGYDDLRAWFRPSSMSQMGISSTSLTFLALAEEGVLWFDFDDVAVDDYADSDDDGVIDPCDACPATGQGVAVGDDGCP